MRLQLRLYSCARAKAAITAVLQLKTVLQAAPLLAAAITANGQEEPRNVLLRTIVDNLTSPELTETAERIDAIIAEDAAYCKRSSQRMLECLCKCTQTLWP